MPKKSSKEPDRVIPSKQLDKGDDKNRSSEDDATEEGSIDIGACSLCHCSLDFSDRAAFFKSDREEDYKEEIEDETEEEASTESSYFFRKDDPYLPESLWDPNNALVYCDSCERMYHQKCHFVPIFSVPRGAWHCIYCVSQKQSAHKAKKKKKPYQSKQVNTNHEHSKRDDSDPLQQFFQELDAASITIPSTFIKDGNSKPASARDLLFVSPPIQEVVEWEHRWESASRFLKAATCHGAFTQMRNAITGQLATHRLAQAGLQTWTSTSHNFHFFQNSQELHDTLIKMFGAEYRIRSWMLAIESCRSTWPGERVWRTLLEWTKDHEGSHDGFVKRVLFPFGSTHPRRVEPKTPEYRLHREEGILSIPKTVDPNTKELLASNKANGGIKREAKGQSSLKQKSSDLMNDDDSGITLDELVCCVCMENHATDENDMVLCDGHGCFRAYHQNCVKPVVCLSGDEADDWFCPLCSGQAELLHHIQSEYMGDEWEQRRIQRQLIAEEMQGRKKKKTKTNEINDSSSLRSWADVNEVFPNADEDYPAAVMLRKGKRNAASLALVSRVLGLDEELDDHEPDVDIDDDIDEDDEQFDLNSYEKRKTEEREKKRLLDHASSKDDTTASSAATLLEMSSVELEIDRDELAALSDGGADEVDESKADGKSVITRKNAKGMRLRSKRVYISGIGYNAGDIGKLDESNIIDGKRGRAPVDYILLNRSIFGGLTVDEAAEIDDDDDFVIKQPNEKSRSSDSMSDSSEESSPGGESALLTPASNLNDGSTEPISTNAERRSKRSRGLCTISTGSLNGKRETGRMKSRAKIGTVEVR